MKVYRVTAETKNGGGFEVEVPVWGWDSYQQFLELDPAVIHYSVEGPFEAEESPDES